MSYAPLSTDCIDGGQQIPISKALGLGANQRRGLTCVVCGKRVVPHKTSQDGSQQAHFEHYRRNAKCPRSDHRTDWLTLETRRRPLSLLATVRQPILL
jgi:hypothetical protein